MKKRTKKKTVRASQTKRKKKSTARCAHSRPFRIPDKSIALLIKTAKSIPPRNISGT